ncbi:MAG TPA: M20/M25/M40 family metallo-hydrolase, partial [Polyangiaceae bacterium]|nr:M20/M25/M40 family metallo-hydrolase [Polyangiaceae bacterium]
KHPDVKVELIQHDATPQPSVMLTIPGKKLPAEQVILGGHMDSINYEQKGGLAPGSDDNASGIAVLSEVIRVALELGYEPDRSVVFYAYAAEEVGLVGSDEIAAQARSSQARIEGVLQLDMTNYNPAPEPYMAIVTDFTDAALNELAKKLIDAYVGIPWKTSECGYACSDHASWSEHGFPAHHVHETINKDSNKALHTAADTLAVSGGTAEHSAHFARYGVAFMAELAKGGIPTPPAGMGGVGGAAVAGGGNGGGGMGTNDGVSPGGNAGSGGSGSSAGAPAVSGGGQAGAPAGFSAAPQTDAGSGCACRTSSARSRSGLPLLGLLGLAALGRRRHRYSQVTWLALIRFIRRQQPHRSA